MRRWYGKRIHADVMIVRANQWSKASGSAAAARPALLCVAKCQSGRGRR
jgi:hypothetical protein